MYSLILPKKAKDFKFENHGMYSLILPKMAKDLQKGYSLWTARKWQEETTQNQRDKFKSNNSSHLHKNRAPQ